MKRIFLIILALSFFGCSSSNLEYVKENAPAKWEVQGFQVIDYEGFKWGKLGFGTSYGGAYVWHRLKKIPDNGVTYSGCMQLWGDELQVYGPEAIDAFRPNNL